MKTKISSIQEILGRKRRFRVPLYQRQYQWDDEFLLHFREDVETKAEEILQGRCKFQHYMGALILYPLKREEGTPVFHIVDGQQRLITFQIFLAALREVAHAYEKFEIIENVETHLFNASRAEVASRINHSKLIPNPSDKKIFYAIIAETRSQVREKHAHWYRAGRVPKNTPRLALRAYEEFYKWIALFVRSDLGGASSRTSEYFSEMVEKRLSALLEAVLQQMKLVIIELGENDDAQVIFEALNSKNRPLLTMDLVRNGIFYRAVKEGIDPDTLYNDLWDHFNADWWHEKAGRPKRHRIDHFLACVIAAETGASVATRELYWKYRAFVDNPRATGEPRFATAEEELKLLRHHAPVYETLEYRRDKEPENKNPSMFRFGRKLADWQNTTAYPIMLQVAKAQLPQEEQKRIVRLIYSYIVRRALCGLTHKNLNLVFRAISQTFIKRGQIQPSYAALHDFFQDKDRDSIRFPSDADFKHGILYEPAYRTPYDARVKDILWELELAHNPESEEKSKPFFFCTVYILPRSREREVTDTLGNLTLRDSYQPENKDFLQRLEECQKSPFSLNRWFDNRDSWTEDDIRERGEHLANLAVQRWPGIEEE